MLKHNLLGSFGPIPSRDSNDGPHRMNTNRDLYRFVTGLCERRSADQVPSLEVYLRSLWFVGRTWDDDIIPIGTLGEWLRSAFFSSPPDFDDAWHSIAFPDEEPDYDPRDLCGRLH